MFNCRQWQAATFTGCLVLTGALFAGCEDSAAQKRTEFQKTINQAAIKLAKATVIVPEPGDEPFDRVKNELMQIEQLLNGAGDANPGQQAAAGLMQASANKQLAVLYLTQTDRIETEHRLLRADLRNRIGAAFRLEAMASGQEDLDISAYRNTLSEAKQRAESQISQFGRAMAALDDPISQLRFQNENDTQELQRLSAQAGELRRKARELGYREGFADFEHAVQIEIEADQFQQSIARRELNLNFDLEPTHELAQQRVAYLRSLLEAINTAQSDLDAIDQSSNDTAGSTRTDVRELHSSIDEDLRKVSGRSEGELQENYDQALAALEKAARQAQNAVRQARQTDDSGNTANAQLAAARIDELTGQMHWARARGLTDHLALLDRMIDADNDGVSSRDRQTTADAYEKAIGQAIAAYESAQEKLEQIRSRELKRQIEPFLASLAQAVAVLSGEPLPTSGSSSTTKPIEATGSSGFESPEELILLMEDIQGNELAVIRRLAHSLHATSPDGRRAKSLAEQILLPTLALGEALDSTFGRDAMAAAAQKSFGAMMSGFSGMAGPQGMSGFPSMPTGGGEGMPTPAAGFTPDQMNLPKPTIINRSSDRVTIGVEDKPEDSLDLTLVSGRWFIDLDDAMADADDDPKAQQMLQMASGIAPTINRVLSNLTKRVRNSEFASPEEVFQVLMLEAQSIMGQMMGAPGDVQPSG